MDIRAILASGRGASGPWGTGFRRAWRQVEWLWMLFLCAGCAPSPIAEPWRRAAGNQPSFAEISADPEFFTGLAVILGGEVAHTRFQPPVTEIEVWQEPLDSGDRPEENLKHVQGRFLVRCPGFLSPADYAPGRPITVAGEIEGQAVQAAEIRPLGPFRYLYPEIRYPVMACRQIQVWPSRRKALEVYAAPYGFGPRWWRLPGYAYPYYHRPFR